MKTRFKKVFRNVLISILIFLFLRVIIFPQKAFVLSMICGGKLVAPEASAILSHYCFGKGDTLYLSPTYFEKSKVVNSAIKGMKTGDDKIVWVHQRDDWRLSYALNGFHILKKKDSYYIYQRIVFDKTGKIHTILNLGFTHIRVSDNIVHTFDCEPFVAVSTIRIN